MRLSRLGRLCTLIRINCMKTGTLVLFRYSHTLGVFESLYTNRTNGETRGQQKMLVVCPPHFSIVCRKTCCVTLHYRISIYPPVFGNDGRFYSLGCSKQKIENTHKCIVLLFRFGIISTWWLPLKLLAKKSYLYNNSRHTNRDLFPTKRLVRKYVIEY